MSILKYDVFLSFRGEDTRDNFTSHLHKELCRKKIETFIDNRLDRGEEISPALYRAIQESKIYVVILSEHYASSSWCLDELTEILKCKEKYGREVIPVFYKVDPSNVRHQRQSYADDFVRHQQQRSKDKVDAWYSRPESKLVIETVNDILKKLNRCVLSNSQGMVGIDKHIEQIQTLLHLESSSIIGIWGMGGIGKSTIASAIYSNLITDFSSGSIIQNVYQEIEKIGLHSVRRKYLSQLLEEEITSSEYNFTFDPRLKRIKVLLIFDDVKDSDQLEALIGTPSNFGQGSKIIVTSRDKQVLKNANVDETYEVTKMDSQDSLQLFFSFAFKQNNPEEPFVSLSKEVLDYAKGLPLALKILGKFLQGRQKEEWESQLQKLEQLPHPEIFNLLKLSYDGLDDDQKDIFLDIACFHRGEYVTVVEQTLDCCGFFTRIGVKVLEDRCLISISKGKVWMHDLIQEMGHEIVRLQNIDPGKRNRLWKPDDIYKVFKKDKGKGTDAIQSIFLNMLKIKKVQLHAKTFKEMCNLRIIKFNSKIPGKLLKYVNRNVTFHAFLKSLPNSLKILHWESFLQTSLPQDFCPENLVTLNMCYSNLEQLWKEEDQDLPNLKRLNLSHSRKLTRLPDLSLCPNIEEVVLSGCISLLQVYSSSFLNKLNWLCLDGCISFQSLDIRSNVLSRSFGLVALHGCHNLQTLLIISRTDVVQSDSWPPFNIDTGTVLKGNGEEDYKIKEFDLRGFRSINEFCRLDVSNCTSLTCLPAELFNLKFLKRLCLGGCLKLEELPEIKETTENLKVLTLDKTAIKELPSSLHHLVGLVELSLRNCTKLKTIPSSIGNLSKLLKLDLTYCESLETFPSSIFKLEYLVGLKTLNLKLCSNLVSLPNNIGCLSSLTELSLQGSSIVNLPESIAHLSSLKSLNLNGCKLLQCVPKLPPNLTHVWAFDCPSIKRMVLNSRWKLMSDFEESAFGFGVTNNQELDATSWNDIVVEAYFKITNDAYRSVVFCFPGSAVPRWFHYCCKGQSVTVKKDSPNLCSKKRLIGFALCAVIDDMRIRFSELRYDFRFISDGEIYSYDHYMPVHVLPGNIFLKQDHTFLWKHHLDLQTIGDKLFHAQNFTFEFQPDFKVKEFGICPLYTKRIEDNMLTKRKRIDDNRPDRSKLSCRIL